MITAPSTEGHLQQLSMKNRRSFLFLSLLLPSPAAVQSPASSIVTAALTAIFNPLPAPPCPLLSGAFFSLLLGSFLYYILHPIYSSSLYYPSPLVSKPSNAGLSDFIFTLLHRTVPLIYSIIIQSRSGHSFAEKVSVF